jgi:Holliday junction resolvase RusA-like endonuclease
MTTLAIDVVGTPAPQGSKRAFVVNGRAVMSESSKKVKPWRQDVAAAAQAAATERGWETPAGAVRVDITYLIARPRYHFGTGRNANVLKPNAPTWVDKKPDRDKLDRATCDALTSSGVIRDDAQIVAGETEKKYANGPTGALIRISVLPQITAPVPVSEGTGEAPPTTRAGAVQGVLTL